MPANVSPATQDHLAAASILVAPALAFRSNTAGENKDLPKRFKFLNWGENKGRTTGARVIVNERTLADLPHNQQLCACDTVELDYEHQSVKGHPNHKEDPRHSAAHGTIEVVQGEGVYFTAQEYTPNGLEHAPNYKDVSGVCRTDPKTGELLLVSSVALTQRGDVAGMEFADHVIALNASNNQLSNNTPSNNKSTTTTMEQNNKYRAMLIKLLGVSPEEGETDITDEAIAAAAESFATTQAALSAKAETKPDEKKQDEQDPIIALTARLDQMEAKNLSFEKAALVNQATAAGKQIPLSAEDIESTSLAVLTSIIDKLPEGEVPTKSKITKNAPDKEVALSSDESSVAKQLGLTDEEYRAANPKK